MSQSTQLMIACHLHVACHVMNIGCPGESTEITIRTVTGESKQDTTLVTGLCVSSVASDKLIACQRFMCRMSFQSVSMRFRHTVH